VSEAKEIRQGRVRDAALKVGHLRPIGTDETGKLRLAKPASHAKGSEREADPNVCD